MAKQRPKGYLRFATVLQDGKVVHYRAWAHDAYREADALGLKVVRGYLSFEGGKETFTPTPVDDWEIS